MNTGGTPSGHCGLLFTAAGDAQGARLHVTAWVNNVSYVKDVWVDAYLMDPSGAVVHSETLILDYQEGAGGGGDFFVLDAPIMAQGSATTPITGLQYRLYYQIGDNVYAEGILHTQALTTPGSGGPAAQITSRPASNSAGDASAAKPRSGARAATKKTGASTSASGPGAAEAPAKRIARRGPSA